MLLNYRSVQKGQITLGQTEVKMETKKHIISH